MSDRAGVGGRPRIVESPEEFERRAHAYFDECEKGGVFKTITGLALAVGFAERQSLYDYQARPEFSVVVKRARLVVENDYEQRLAGGKPTGAIFALKNMGWRDRHELDHRTPDGPLEVVVTERVIFPDAED